MKQVDRIFASDAVDTPKFNHIYVAGSQNHFNVVDAQKNHLYEMVLLGIQNR